MSTVPGINGIRVAARDINPSLKVLVAIIGLVAAAFWVTSAISVGSDAASWKPCAAIATAASMALQAITALIDKWISPTATWR